MSHPESFITTTPPLSGLALVQAINAWLASLKDGWAGDTPPPNPIEGQIWIDTSGAAVVPRRLIGGQWREVITRQTGDFRYLRLSAEAQTLTGALTVTGTVTTGGPIKSNNDRFVGSDGTRVIVAPDTGSAATGSVLLRPRGSAAITNQTEIDNNGVLTASGSVRAGGGDGAILGATGGIAGDTGTFSSTVRSGGDVFADVTNTGVMMGPVGFLAVTTPNATCVQLNRRFGDGVIQSFLRSQAGVGNISVTTSGTDYNSPCDEELKEDFRDFDSGAMIDAMEMFDFAWKGSGTRGIGPKAQQLHQIFPAGVTPGRGKPKDADYEPWMWNGNPYIALLIREMQRVRQRLAAAEARIDELEGAANG